MCLLDVATRENLLLRAWPSYPVKELTGPFPVYGKPKKIRFDNGPEFRSKKPTNFRDE